MLTEIARSGIIDSGRLAVIYMELKESVIRAGYGPEVDWQTDLDFELTTETDFLREAAWVVLSSGFRESVVRQYFHRISEAFLDWRSAKQISKCRELCRNQAVSVFGHRGKIDAIAEIVMRVADDGIEHVKLNIRSRGVEYLQEFPFIGPVTSYHLAKNLGLGVVKPDRHLVRMARITGHGSPTEICSMVAGTVGDPVAVVDLVFWRYATINKEYQTAIYNLVNGTGETGIYR